MIEEVITKCSTPNAMIVNICKTCKRNAPKESDEDQFEQFFPRKNYMGKDWKCDGYLRVDCKWKHEDELKDEYCVNGNSEFCTEYVGGEDSYCVSCKVYEKNS